MTMLELFEAARRPYAKLLSAAVSHREVHVEPALRLATGEVALSGLWNTPYRPDYIPRNGNGTSVTVDSTSKLDFEPITVNYGDCQVRINPFVWDWVSLTVSGLPEPELQAIAREWFFRWFDAEDTNDCNSEGLFGVVHYLGEPTEHGNELQINIDLGSAPPEALNDILESLATGGANNVRVA